MCEIVAALTSAFSIGAAETIHQSVGFAPSDIRSLLASVVAWKNKESVVTTHRVTM